MKLKASPLKFLLGLIMAITAIGFTACGNNDDDLDHDVYQGHIKGIYDNDPYTGLRFFIIEVSNLPKNAKKEIKKNDLLQVALTDFPNLDLKVNQKLSFRIITTKRREWYPEFCSIIPVSYDWICEITILKIN